MVTNDSARWGLRWLPLDDWLARFTAPQSNASPQYWTIDNDGSLLLGPAPDVAATIEMQYWSAPTELAADADEPNIPASYHMLLVWGALAEAGGFDSAPEMFARGAANHDRMHSMFKREFGEEIKFEVASL